MRYPDGRHRETHRTDSVGWLRAAVLGANDGLISTSSLIVGVAAATPERGAILLAGAAGMVAGALSMAAGEYVSVSSQSDSEDADLAKERAELETTPDAELTELAAIYVSRGLTPDLARQVALQFTKHDALAAHARDELGIFDFTRARPVQAALTSAAAFACGAGLPLLLAGIAPVANITPIIGGSSLLLLFVLGALAAKLGGARPRAGALRVAFWGTVAMAATALVGKLFGTAV
jgi:VIT1/CCC1 family predicted Fe2+/Mn2+ transporter